MENSLTDGLLSTGLTGLCPESFPDLPAEGFSPGVLWGDKKGSQHTSITAQGGGGSSKNRKPLGEIGCCESPMAEQKH